MLNVYLYATLGIKNYSRAQRYFDGCFFSYFVPTQHNSEFEISVFKLYLLY